MAGRARDAVAAKAGVLRVVPGLVPPCVQHASREQPAALGAGRLELHALRRSRAARVQGKLSLPHHAVAMQTGVLDALFLALEAGLLRGLVRLALELGEE